MRHKLLQQRFGLMWLGYLVAICAWYASVKWLPISSFQRLPDPLTVVIEWFNPDPDYGLSVFTGLGL